VKIVTVVGARPQFVKAATVSRILAERPEIEEVLVHTGQHFDANMSGVFFKEMEIPPPRYNLDIHSLNHGAMTGRMLEGIERVLLDERPDCVLVYGDTNSTLAGALAARKLHHRVIHVEAGLRSWNMRMPEEVNRVLTDRISDLLCCPTDRAMENLRSEGFDRTPIRVVKTGDVMQDAAYHYRERAFASSTILRRLKLVEGEFALCTVHRPENTDDPARLGSIMGALNEISRKIRMVLPLHPRTAEFLVRSAIRPGFEPIPPVGYFDMIRLLAGAAIVLTDSGGVQKEAFFFGKPCVTFREETEWVELVEGGFNQLAGSETARILAAYARMRSASPDFSADLYGRGSAARRTVDAILSAWGG